MTYDSLLTDLRQYLERGYTQASDATVWDQLPNFIGFSQRRLARELKTLGTIQVVASTMTVGEPTYPKPDRWRTTVSMRIETDAGTVEVYPRAYEYCSTYWPNRTLTGEPRFVADYNLNNWFVVPTPDAEYAYEILYNELPVLLSAETQTNYYTEMTPDALLYGALLEAGPFLKNPEIQATWTGYFDRALAALNGEDMARFTSRQIKREQN